MAVVLTTDPTILALRDLVDEALDVAYHLPDDQRQALGAINWADLQCVDVEWRTSLLYPQQYGVCVLIEEAAPEAVELHNFVEQYLRARGQQASVETAW